jgi:radical SAM superfamily enzyme YgiQ (UPF0313 family)
MKISLIQLPLSPGESPSLPLGLFSLSSSIKRVLNVSPNILDIQLLMINGAVSFDEDFYERVIRIIEKGKPDILGMQTLCISHHIAVSIAKLYKRKHPSTKIVLGGPHASATDETTLEAFPFIDFVVRGEAEISLVQLIKHIDDPAMVKGVTWRDEDGAIRRNPDQPLIDELDDYIYPDKRLNRLYRPYFRNMRHANLEAGRGCPFKCTYCSTSVFWKRASRMRSPRSVFEHMRYFLDTFKINHFSFTTDNFTLNRKWLSEFARVLSRNRKLELSWSCASKIDCLTPALIKKLSSVGLDSVFIGIESGSYRMQRIIKKNNKLAMLYPVVRECLRRDVDCKVFFMAGFPEETSADLNATLEMMLRLALMGIREYFLNFLIPLSGTEIFSKEKGKLIPIDLRSGTPNLAFQVKEFKRLDRYGLIAKWPDIFAAYYNIRTKHIPLEYCRKIHITCHDIFRYYSRSFSLFKNEFKLTAYDVFRDYFKYLDRHMLRLSDVSNFPKFIRARIKKKNRAKDLPEIIRLEDTILSLSTKEASVNIWLPKELRAFYRSVPRLTEKTAISEFEFDVFKAYDNIKRRPKPSPSTYIYTCLEDGGLKHRRLKAREVVLLNLIDGRRSCGEIFEIYHEGRDEGKWKGAMEFILSLITNGHVYLRK